MKKTGGYINSSCSRHMTSDKKIFSHFEEIDYGNVRFNDNGTRRIVGKGNIGINPKIEGSIFCKLVNCVTNG